MEGLNANARLPRYRVLDTGSIEESRATLCREVCPHSLVPGRDAQLRTLHSRVSFRNSSLHYIRYGAPVRVENARLEDNYLVLLPCSGTSLLQLNSAEMKVEQGHGAVIAPGSRFEIEGDGGAETLIWRVQAGAVTGKVARQFPDAWRCAYSLPLHDEMGAGFLRAMRFVLSEMTHQGGPAEQPVFRDRLEELLLAALIGTDASRSARNVTAPACVKRAEAYIADNVNEDLSFADLVAASGVGARTLSRAFRTFRGCTPMMHMRRVRMQRIRTDLLNAGAGDSVTAILSRRGITQFGRFAAEYQRAYGELPSTSLRIAREGNCPARRS